MIFLLVVISGPSAGGMALLECGAFPPLSLECQKESGGNAPHSKTRAPAWRRIRYSNAFSNPRILINFADLNHSLPAAGLDVARQIGGRRFPSREPRQPVPVPKVHPPHRPPLPLPDPAECLPHPVSRRG